MGHSYIDRIILEKFQEKIHSVENQECKTALNKLYQLYALSTIENNKGWYLEQGYLDGIKTKAIRKEVDLLCLEVRQEALLLIDSFKIPDSTMAASIATNY